MEKPTTVDLAEFWELKTQEVTLEKFKVQLSDAQKSALLIQQNIKQFEPEFAAKVKSFFEKYALVEGKYEIDPKTGSIKRFDEEP